MAKKQTKFEFSKIGSLIDDIAKKTPITIEKENKNVERISTGVYILNASMSGSLWGGVKGDAITVFAGPEASGKSFLALNTCREAQNKGYGIIYIDTENSIERGELTKFGIDNSNDKFYLIKTNKIEDINITLTQLLDDLKEKKLKGMEIGKFMIVIDSLAQMASNKEKEDLISGKLKQDMTKAKAIGSLFRSITIDLGYLEIPMIVNNQTYQTMDLFPQEIMKGGKSLYYSASNITFLGKSKLKTGKEDENEMQSGIKVKAKSIKNRQAKPKKVEFQIEFEQGCNPFIGLEMFCVPRFFDKIGIAKGKFKKYKTPKEVVNKQTGEVTLKEGEFEPGGNRWYVKHLGKSVWTKDLHTDEVFTDEVLESIEPIANAYFRYKSMEEIKEFEKELKEKASQEEDFEEVDMDDLSAEDLFDEEK
jgi:RecA/RadA recombinase